jgi:prolyl-tRNA editing enzyme YbaK/EbsC (Cys-tRNA(Pro) deacylase)
MSQTLSASAQKIQDVLNEFGMSHSVVQVPDSARTAAEAALAIGCGVEQIAKSLVFMTTDTHEPILVIACGSNRVNEEAVAKVVSHPLRKAQASFVLEKTGYAIGGIPPVGHKVKITTLIDKDLLELTEIWAAAGTPHAVFRLTPDELVTITGGQVISVA